MDSMSGGRAEREGDTESKAGPRLSAYSLTRGSHLTNVEIMTWAETKSQTLNWLSDPGVRKFLVFKDLKSVV